MSSGNRAALGPGKWSCARGSSASDRARPERILSASVQLSARAADAELSCAEQHDRHRGEEVEALQFECPPTAPGQIAKLTRMSQEDSDDHVDCHKQRCGARPQSHYQ